MQTHRHPGLSAALARSLRGLTLAATLGLLAACGGGAQQQSFGPQRAEPVTVVVQRGDTLLAIARRHGVGLSPLAAANGLSAPYVIRPGQVLHVPTSGVPLAPPVMVASAGSSLGVGAAPEPVGVATAPAPSPISASSATPARAVIAEALPPPPGPPPAPPPQAAAQPSPPSPPAQAQTQTQAQRQPQAQAQSQARAEREPARAAPRETARRMPPGRFAWPVRGRVVSAFGSKGGGLVNDGLNIAAPQGTPVRAAAHGTVIYAGNGVRGFGNLILIRHEGGWVTAYGHNERLLVRQGQAVRTGQEIARVGSTGAVASPQLHFQVRRDGRPVDPAAHLDRAVATRSS